MCARDWSQQGPSDSGSIPPTPVVSAWMRKKTTLLRLGIEVSYKQEKRQARGDSLSRSIAEADFVSNEKKVENEEKKD